MDVTVVLNVRAELVLFYLSEDVDAGIRVDPSDFYNVVRYCRPDTETLGKGYLHSLQPREVDTD